MQIVGFLMRRLIWYCHGQFSLLQIIPHRPEKFEGQLDFGTMGVRENRSILFTLLNDNPIEVCSASVFYFCYFTLRSRLHMTLAVGGTLNPN